ncbi:hypothetical protein CCHR01_19644 [Colletotrichum chrysophilum]|uniref:Uncharacterized protein n=1 Tax=Colletotrichum chrysophilum TaxID=1836956 RepID=A0AAD8ZY22_9PEZI|nr:hypothetical protein CCHR01_19644 [Colletotrichum chrysophilum]
MDTLPPQTNRTRSCKSVTTGGPTSSIAYLGKVQCKCRYWEAGIVVSLWLLAGKASGLHCCGCTQVTHLTKVGICRHPLTAKHTHYLWLFLHTCIAAVSRLFLLQPHCSPRPPLHGTCGCRQGRAGLKERRIIISKGGGCGCGSGSGSSARGPAWVHSLLPGLAIAFPVAVQIAVQCRQGR